MATDLGSVAPSETGTQPAWIGPYRILELVGEGGMGVVYKAEQRTPVRRIVAVKLIKLGMDTEEVIARFESERQALALLNHPNVATVYDAGATELGRPYFVMEYVHGESITDFCDRHNFTTRQRLELFTCACEAMQHAHQKAIIHRDLKPSNLLVTLDREKPVLKVIDFGIAKATSQRLTERTMFTEQGRMIGTPEYMSPEQADTHSVDVDTRADIYSLGMVLYELLSGTLPFDSSSLRAGYAEAQRIIREVDAPRPSAMLTRMGEAAAAIARRRQTDRQSLERELRRELEWIPMMALRKDRALRYRTAIELAEDIRNYLEHRPLVAGPESARYRVGKFLRRNKGPTLTALSIVAALAIGLTVATVGFVRASRARAAETQRLYAANLNLAQEAWNRADVPGVIELLDRTSPQSGAADLRGFEWFRLWRLCHSARIVIPVGPGQDGGSPAIYSPDGALIATAIGSSVRRWDAATGEELPVLRWKEGLIKCIAFSPDSRYLFAGGAGPAAAGGIGVLWEHRSGKLLWHISPDEPVIAATFEPRVGKLIATSISRPRDAAQRTGRMTDNASPDQTAAMIMLLDTSSGQCVTTLREKLSAMTSLAFAPDGRTLVAAAPIVGNVRVWDLESRQLRPASRQRISTQSVTIVAFSPDAEKLVIGTEPLESAPGEIKLLDPLTLIPDPSFAPAGHTDGIAWLSFSADSSRLASASYDRTARVWDARGREIAVLRGHRDVVLSACFSPDGSRLVTRGRDNSVRVWDLDPGQNTAERTIPQAQSSVAYSSNGLLATVEANDVKLFNPDGNTVPVRLEMEGYPSRTLVAFAQDGKALAAVNGNGCLRIWSTDDWQQRDLNAGLSDSNPRSLEFSPDSQVLAHVDEAGQCTLWNVATGAKRSVISPTLGSGVRDVSFSPDGKSLFATNLAGVQVWSWEDARLNRTIKGSGGDLVACSPDGTKLATAQQRLIRIYDLSSEQWTDPSLAQGTEVAAIAFSPDGKRVASASIGGDGSVQLWSSDNGALLATYAARGCKSVAFSPDGTRLAAVRNRGQNQSEAVIWEAVPRAAVPED